MVKFIFDYYKTDIGDLGPKLDQNALTSDNYIFWITNNLALMYGHHRNPERGDIIEKLIDGPSYKKTGEDISKDVVEATHKHVHRLLMNIPQKDLLALIGAGKFFN